MKFLTLLTEIMQIIGHFLQYYTVHAHPARTCADCFDTTRETRASNLVIGTVLNKLALITWHHCFAAKPSGLGEHFTLILVEKVRCILICPDEL